MTDQPTRSLRARRKDWKKKGWRTHREWVPPSASKDAQSEDDEDGVPSSFSSVVDKSQDHQSPKDDEVSDLEDDGHFPHRLHSRYPSSHKLSAEGRQALIKDEGFKIRKGKWNVREKRQLKKNFDEIVHSFARPELDGEEKVREVRLCLLGLLSKIDRSGKISKKELFGKRSSDEDGPWKMFLFKLGKGLPRRLMPDIFFYARMWESGLRFAKDLTEKEKRDISETKAEQQRLGLSDLGYEFNCDPSAVNHVIRVWLTPSHEIASKDYFSIIEQRQLLSNVMKAMGVNSPHELNAETINCVKTRRFSWNWLASQLDTKRTASDCRKEVFRILEELRRPSTSNVAKVLTQSRKKIKKDMAKIIWFVYYEKQENENAVDWYYLGELMSQHPMRVILQMWDELKEMVPPNKRTTHRKQIKWLKKHKLPEFMKLNEKNLSKLNSFYSR